MNNTITRAAIQQRINHQLRALVKAIDSRAPVNELTAINQRLAALRAQRDQIGRAAQ